MVVLQANNILSQGFAKGYRLLAEDDKVIVDGVRDESF
jgi:hypothetical protein